MIMDAQRLPGEGESLIGSCISWYSGRLRVYADEWRACVRLLRMLRFPFSSSTSGHVRVHAEINCGHDVLRAADARTSEARKCTQGGSSLLRATRKRRRVLATDAVRCVEVPRASTAPA